MNFIFYSIQEVMVVFPDQDPAVLYDIYLQVSRKKDLLIDTILNGGVLPEDDSDDQDEME